jgi:hypothetical protein
VIPGHWGFFLPDDARLSKKSSELMAVTPLVQDCQVSHWDEFQLPNKSGLGKVLQLATGAMIPFCPWLQINFHLGEQMLSHSSTSPVISFTVSCVAELVYDRRRYVIH